MRFDDGGPVESFLCGPTSGGSQRSAQSVVLRKAKHRRSQRVDHRGGRTLLNDESGPPVIDDRADRGRPHHRLSGSHCLDDDPGKELGSARVNDERCLSVEAGEIGIRNLAH